VCLGPSNEKHVLVRNSSTQQLLQLLREFFPDVVPTTTTTATTTTVVLKKERMIFWLTWPFSRRIMWCSRVYPPRRGNSVLQPYFGTLATNNTAEPLNGFFWMLPVLRWAWMILESYGGDDEGAEEVCNLRFKYVLETLSASSVRDLDWPCEVRLLVFLSVSLYVRQYSLCLTEER
jgi:hypothetical protein